jgi:hypothetical protein
MDRGRLTRLRARLLAIVRSRILSAVAEFYGLEPDDEVGLAGEPQELTDAIMAALFTRTRASGGDGYKPPVAPSNQ